MDANYFVASIFLRADPQNHLRLEMRNNDAMYFYFFFFTYAPKWIGISDESPGVGFAKFLI